MKSNNLSWTDFYNLIKDKVYFNNLIKFIDSEYENKTIYPKKHDVLNAFKLCKFEDLKVIIIGQDPYHEVNQANGLAFSVNKGVKLPPSLVNIFKEIEIEFNVSLDKNNGDLQYLSKQGVLLLNKYLTVEEGKPLSHKIDLYDYLFKDLISFIEKDNRTIVYLLWGNESQKVKKYIYNKNHFIIEASHPSPLSANKGGWFNSNCFIKCNDILNKNNILPINWYIK